MRPGGNRAPRVTGVPIWLLDVDGVLNAVCHPSRPPRTWDSWRSGTAIAAGERFVITFAPELMTGIRDLHESGMVEIRWLTTWGHDANRSLRHLLELPEFPVAGEPAYAEAWWKLPCAVRAAQDERPLIWTDDDLDYSEPARAWAAKLDALTIAPEPTVWDSRPRISTRSAPTVQRTADSGGRTPAIARLPPPHQPFVSSSAVPALRSEAGATLPE